MSEKEEEHGYEANIKALIKALADINVTFHVNVLAHFQ